MSNELVNSQFSSFIDLFIVILTNKSFVSSLAKYPLSAVGDKFY